jgi:hypothetical protein
MRSRDLKKLVEEVEAIDLLNQPAALVELRAVLTALIEHAYFRQLDHERERRLT